MTLPTRRSMITGLGAGAGLATAGLLSHSPASAADRTHSFSSVIFDEQFSQGADFSSSRWRDNSSEPESCTSYDWGVFTHDTHSVSDGVGHVLWRKRATPLKGFQNRFDKQETVRYVDQAFVTTEGLFSFIYGSLETRARFPQSDEGLFAGIWLRADQGKNGGEIDVVETYGGGSATGIAESTVHFGQAGGSHRVAHLWHGEDPGEHPIPLRWQALSRGTPFRLTAGVRRLLRPELPVPHLPDHPQRQHPPRSARP